MSKYQAPCLIFAAVCLAAAAGVSTANWLACTRGQGGAACRPDATVAAASFVTAANVALGTAVQDPSKRDDHDN
jgi:hypothetical protein